MKLTTFTKKMSSLFKHCAAVRMDLSVHGETTILEVNVEEYGVTAFEVKVNPPKYFVAIINLEQRFGLKESNFEKVPEPIRAAVFETVNDFVSTPVNKR